MVRFLFLFATGTGGGGGGSYEPNEPLLRTGLTTKADTTDA